MRCYKENRLFHAELHRVKGVLGEFATRELPEWRCESDSTGNDGKAYVHLTLKRSHEWERERTIAERAEAGFRGAKGLPPRPPPRVSASYSYDLVFLLEQNAYVTAGRAAMGTRVSIEISETADRDDAPTLPDARLNVIQRFWAFAGGRLPIG